MTANTTPIFTATPNIGRARVTVANTAADGSGALETLFTAGANGSRVEQIRYNNSQATAAASSAMVIRFFITDTAGANPRLLAEVPLASVTRTASVAGAGGIYPFPKGLFMPSGSLLKVGQSVFAGVQDQMDYVAEGGDF